MAFFFFRWHTRHKETHIRYKTWQGPFTQESKSPSYGLQLPISAYWGRNIKESPTYTTLRKDPVVTFHDNFFHPNCIQFWMSEHHELNEQQCITSLNTSALTLSLKPLQSPWNYSQLQKQVSPVTFTGSFNILLSSKQDDYLKPLTLKLGIQRLIFYNIINKAQDLTKLRKYSNTYHTQTMLVLWPYPSICFL